MNGLFNNNFLFGFLLAKERKDQNEQLRFGLQASQFANSNPMGLLLLKGQLDSLKSVEDERDALKLRLDAKRSTTGTDFRSFAGALLKLEAAEEKARGEVKEDDDDEDLVEKSTETLLAEIEYRGVERDTSSISRGNDERINEAFASFMTGLEANKKMLSKLEGFRSLLIDLIE